MKIRIDKYAISINEDDLKKSKRQAWINGRVKDFEYTGIGREVLKERFSEVYDMVKGEPEDGK